jgi:hypothetical protein
MLSADYSISLTDPNLLILNPGGSNRNVSLPNPTGLTPGHTYNVSNPSGATGNLVLKSSGGSKICTLTPGTQTGVVTPIPSTSGFTWPTSVSPATPV